jgi:hypothetical protein
MDRIVAIETIPSRVLSNYMGYDSFSFQNLDYCCYNYSLVYWEIQVEVENQFEPLADSWRQLYSQ